MRKTDDKLVLVVRQTRLDELVARFNTKSQARFYVEHLGADFSDYQREDQVYKAAVRQVHEDLNQHGRVQVVDRAFLPNFLFGPSDLVITLGQDGLVANVLKYLEGQPVIGVNPDPARWEGVLLPFEPGDLSQIVPEVMADKRSRREVTMAEARLNDGQTLLGVNDLFIGPKSHSSARYSLRIGEREEHQSSSGIIVSTGLGSTGWLRSIVAGASGIASQLLEQPIQTPTARFEWESDYLCFSVREPWPSTTTSADITFGHITRDTPLQIVSQMPEHGVIFSDGMEKDFLKFNSGTRADISLAATKGQLVV